MLLTSLDDVPKIFANDSVTFSLSSLSLEPNKLFLLVRNLSLPVEHVKLDFSNVDVDYWTECYLKSEIKVEICDLIYCVIERLKAFVDCSTGIDYSRHPKFICQNSQILGKLCNFCISSIYYAVQIQTQSKQHFQNIIDEPLPINSIFLLKYIKQFETSICSLKSELSFYQCEFNDENNCIFIEMLKQSIFGLILYGQTTPQWGKFVSLMGQLQAITQ